MKSHFTMHVMYIYLNIFMHILGYKLVLLILGTKPLSLSLSLSLYIYIYILIS